MSIANEYLNPLTHLGKTKTAADNFAGVGPTPDAPQYNPNHQNFQYGLGPSDSYANQQSWKYDQQQAQLQALAGDAYNRQAPTQAMPQDIQFQQSGGQGYLNGAGNQARLQQLQALGGLGQTNQSLGAFAQGGSQATQGAIQQAADLGARQQFGFARAQPGGGGSALRNAAFGAAGIMNNAGNTAAIASQQDRAQSLAALQAQQGGQGALAGYTGQLRGQDIGLAQTQAGQANYDAGAQNQFNQGQQQLQFNVGQNNLNANLSSRQQADAMTLGALGQAQQYEDYRNQNAAGQAQAGYNYESARAQGAGLGVQNYQTGVQQQNETRDRQMKMAGTALSLFSDVRVKKDIKPAEVASAYTGKYTPQNAKALYEQQTSSREGLRSQLNEARDHNALYSGGGGFDRDYSEFGGLPSRVGYGQAGDARQERMRQLTALGGGNQAQAFADRDPEGFDNWADSRGWDRAPDLRPAQGYEYAYKDPDAHGQGRYVGPMAQDLEHLPGVVEQDQSGAKTINAPRLTLANTAAVSDQQRRLDELERRQRLMSLGFTAPPAAPDYASLDAAYARGQTP